MPAIHRLKYPAPRREPVKTENGWASKPWSPEGVLSTVRGGGHFSGEHDFESDTAKFAADAERTMAVLLSSEVVA